MSELVAAAVERADLDELVRVVDGLCASRDWDALFDLRERCTRAIERGRQLWSVAHLAEYRLALEAPADFAGAVLVEGAGRFGLGPIAEVAASTHTWGELAPHAPAGPVAALAAHERVVRGEDLDQEPVAPVLDVPLRLQSWEPPYALAVYRPESAEFPTPELRATFQQIELPRSAELRVDPEACRALVELADTWTTSSNGRARAIAVHGDAMVAIAALAVARVRVAEVSSADALALMAWAAGSGGAFGRRRGAAVGRFEAWRAAAAIAGLDDGAFSEADELGHELVALRWFVFDDLDAASTGWSLRLAIEDGSSGRGWAVVASDRS